MQTLKSTNTSKLLQICTSNGKWEIRSFRILVGSFLVASAAVGASFASVSSDDCQDQFKTHSRGHTMMVEEAKNEERHDGRGKLKTCFHYLEH